MSVWRRKALECLPEKRTELQQPDFSIYEMFSMLLEEVILMHREGNHEKLKQYYDFAEWCSEQREKQVWNAVGVSFYEHLGDQEETLRDMPRWIKKSTYLQIRGLLQQRLTATALLKLDKTFDTN